MDKIIKSQHGQFFTTQYQTIFDGFSLDKTIFDKVDTIIEPFVGNGDLIQYLYENLCDSISKKQLICNDLFLQEETRNKISQWFPSATIFNNDLFKTPIQFKDSFLITNPPFLAKNKSIGDKSIYKEWDSDDLYKCFLNMILRNDNLPYAGILITPLNFWCSARKKDVSLRKRFLDQFHVKRLNIFMEKVFEDTSSTVTSFYFTRRDEPISDQTKSTYHIDTFWYPTSTQSVIYFNLDNNFTIGGEICNLPKYSSYWKVWRITGKDIIHNNNLYFTQILVKCIDDSDTNQINFSLVDHIQDIYIDNTPNYSARSYCSIAIQPNIDIDKQKILATQCNEFLNKYREKYTSLFLSNYRESKHGFARKRLSFDLLYKIVLYHLENISIFKHKIE